MFQSAKAPCDLMLQVAYISKLNKEQLLPLSLHRQVYFKEFGQGQGSLDKNKLMFSEREVIVHHKEVGVADCRI